MNGTITHIDYDVRRGDGDDIELVITVHGIAFQQEVITYGELAGAVGHREVPTESTQVLNLHPAEAAHLRDRLDAVLSHGVV